MPLYTYWCEPCDSARVLQHGMDDAEQKLCYVCFHPMKKRPDIGGVSFRGPGFYRTDSR